MVALEDRYFFNERILSLNYSKHSEESLNDKIYLSKLAAISMDIKCFIATLGSILDSQPSWESGKFQLARWSHEVVIFPERTNHPPTLKWNVRCPPPRPLKHLRALCGVPTLVWKSVHITSIRMCGVRPFWASDQMSQIGMCGVPPT